MLLHFDELIYWKPQRFAIHWHDHAWSKFLMFAFRQTEAGLEQPVLAGHSLWGALDAKKKVPCLLQVFPESEAKCVGVVSREGWFLLFLWCFCLTVWNYHESIIWFSCFCIALEGNQLNPGRAVRQQHCACAHVAFDIFLNACQAWARRHPSDGTNEKVKVFKRDFGRYVHSLASLAKFFCLFLRQSPHKIVSC